MSPGRLLESEPGNLQLLYLLHRPVHNCNSEFIFLSFPVEQYRFVGCVMRIRFEETVHSLGYIALEAIRYEKIVFEVPAQYLPGGQESHIHPFSE